MSVQRKLRIYAERDHYDAAYRRDLTDIPKAFWNDATREERRAKYGRRDEQFELVSSPDAADLHVLTMKWHHYVETGRIDQALRAVETARRVRRPLAVFSLGDFEANFPVPGKDIHLFQASAYRSRTATTNHGMPPFVDDPCEATPCALREKGALPVLGFCGQAGASVPRHGARYLRNRWKRVLWRLRRERWEPPPLEHTWFRQRVLDAFANSRAVETRYVLRTKYRAGVHSDDRNDPAQQARREFLENVLGTDYTICMRGGGNFSIRFYEALAMSRIPAFIDTDCILPFHDLVDWRHHVVWIDARELQDAPRIVSAFHARLSAAEFRERQQACRQLWVTRLTPDGFYGHFHEHFPELA